MRKSRKWKVPCTTKIETSHQRLKQQAIEKAYLLYYNKILFEQGLITEQERNRMIPQINNQSNTAR